MVSEMLPPVGQLPLSSVTDVDFEARIETIAVSIERLQATTVLRIAERLAEAHKLYLYRRDEGGFQGWVERRLSMSRATAYNLLNVHKTFGQNVSNALDTLPHRVLYLLSPDSTPESVRTEVMQRAEAGEHFTQAQVNDMIDKAVAEARKNDKPAFEAQIAELRQEADRREQSIRDEYAGKLFADPAEIQKKIDEAIAPLNRQIDDAKAKIRARGETRRRLTRTVEDRSDAGRSAHEALRHDRDRPAVADEEDRARCPPEPGRVRLPNNGL